MVHIEITNFQSIAKMSLDFEGFSTIVGKNFIGKSATLRAINAALTNRQGTDFIRWGEKYCEVRIVVKDYDILWHKEDGNNFYKINGVAYNKIGKDEPPEILKEAGFGVIRLGSERISLNYAQQFFPLFLIDKLDTKGADLLTSVYGLDVLYKALDLCGKDQKKNKDELRVRSLDLSYIEKDLVSYDGFDEILTQGETLKAIKKDLFQKYNKVELLKTKNRDVRSVYASCNKLKNVLSIEIPDCAAIDALSKSLITLKPKLESFNSLHSCIAKIKSVTEVEIPLASDIEPLYKKLEVLKKLHASFKNTEESLLKFKGIDSVPVVNVEDLSVSMDRLSVVGKLKKSIDSLRKSLEAYSGLDAIKIPIIPDSIESLNGLKLKKETIQKIAKEVAALKKEIEDTSSSFCEVEKELSSYAVCPLCGK